CDRLEKEHGERPLFIPCDVTDIASLRSAITQAADAHDPIEILVNNAAWDDRHSLDELSVEQWDYMLNVNIRHHFFAIQAVASGMRANGGGTVVNFSSIAYMMGDAGF